MYITICEIDDQSKFDACNRALKASAWGQPRGMGWGGKKDWGLGQADTCTSVADSCQRMAKTTTILSSPGKNTGVGCHFLLQGIFPTQGMNLGLLHCRQML